MTKRSREIEDYWDRVRELGCIITGQPNPTIHHCHGGSLRELGVTKGMACKTSDWLVIPLAAELHSIGPCAIDGSMGVKAWEEAFGRQVDHLEEVSLRLGVDVWAKAGVNRGH